MEKQHGGHKKKLPEHFKKRTKCFTVYPHEVEPIKQFIAELRKNVKPATYAEKVKEV